MLIPIDWSRFLSSQYPSSPSLVAAYAALKGVLAAPNADLLSYASRLSDAILRALDTIHHFLFSPPNPGPVAHTQTALGAPSQLKPEHIGSTRIALASPLLMYTLRTGLHALVRTAQDSTKSKRPRQRAHATTPATTDAHAHVDKVLDRLLERVLLPLLRAIVPLCHARLAPLVSVSLKKDRDKAGRAAGKGKGKDKDKRSASSSVDPPEKTDVRADVFAFIGTSLDALDALPPLVRPDPNMTADKSTADGGSIAAGIRDRLGLEVIRELEGLYLVPPTVTSSASLNSLQPPSQQPPATPSQPPPPSLSTSTPAPTPTHPHPQSQPQVQPRAQRTVPESRAKRLEKLAGSRADRVRALAMRDAGWFLASTLNLCVTPPAGRTDGSGGLLKEALLDRIGKLVRSVHVPFGILVSEEPGQESSDTSEALNERAAADRNATDAKFTIDPVCQNMLLAICERAMSNLVSS